MTITMNYDEFVTLAEDGGAACTACGEIYESGFEPDAENYLCEGCGMHKVCGLEQLVILGKITFDEED